MKKNTDLPKKLPKNNLLEGHISMKYVLVILIAIIVINTAAVFKPETTPKLTIDIPEPDTDQPGTISHINDTTNYSNATENLYETNYQNNYQNASLNETENFYESNYETNYEANYHNTSYLNETDNLYEYNTDFYNSSNMNYSDYLYNTLHNNSYIGYNESYYNYSYLNDTNITSNGYTFNINQTNNTYNNYTNIYYNYNTTHYNTTTGAPTQSGYNNSETFYIPDRGWENKSKTTPEDRQKLYWTIDFGHNVSEIWIVPQGEVVVSFDAYIGNAQYINSYNYYGFPLTNPVNKFEITTDCMTLYAKYGVFSTYWDKYLSASVYIIVFGNW